MRRRILIVTGLILVWTLLVIAVVFAKAVWFAHPSVIRGDFTSIERHLIQELREAAWRTPLKRILSSERKQ